MSTQDPQRPAITSTSPAERRRAAADRNQPAPQQLHGKLGTGSIVFMVIAAAAPLTVIGGNAPISIGAGNGIGAPVGFIIAAVVLLLFSVGFVAMTPFVKEAGAFFSYVTKGLGSRWGLGTAFVSLVAYTAIQVGIYGYLGWAVDDLVQHFGGPALPWGLYSFLAVALVAFLGYRRIELSSKVLGVALVAEIGVVVILDAVIFARGGAGGLVWDSFAPSVAFTPGLSVAVLFALTGFIGFEATAVFRDEARNPERTIPRATYLAVVIIGVFYCISCWAMVVGGGREGIVTLARDTLAGNANMLVDITGRYLGVVFQDIVQVLLVTSLFACVLSFHNVIARYQFALAGKGVLPTKLGKVHPKHGSPAFSSLVQTLTATVIVAAFVFLGVEPLVGVFGSMAGVATVGMVTLMLLTSVAVLVFFARHPLRGRLLQTRFVPILATLGLATCAWVVLSNFTMVTGAGVVLSTVLACLPPLACLLGLVLGKRFKLDGVADESAGAVASDPRG